MAIASSLNISHDLSSFGNRAMRWLLPAAFAMPATSIGWSLFGDVRLEFGVAAAALTLFGWRGFVSAFIGIMIVDFLLAPGVELAVTLLVATGLGAAVCGLLLRHAQAVPGFARLAPAIQLFVATGSGGAIGAIATLPTSDAIVTALNVWLCLWAGALLSAPLLIELLDASAERPTRRTLIVLLCFFGLATVATLDHSLMGSARIPLLTMAATVAVLGVVIASPKRLVLSLVLALIAAVLAAVTPVAEANAGALIGSLGTLALVPLLLAIGLADRPLIKMNDSQAAGESMFDAVMRFLPVGIFRLGIDGRMRYTNPMFQTLTGLNANSLRGWLDTINAEDRERIGKAWEHLREGATAFDEIFRVGEPGTPRWLSARVSPEYEHGAVVGYIGTVSDITTQRLAEEARTRSDAQSRAVVDNAVDAIVTIDAVGTIASFNRAAHRMFGYSPAEAIGHNVSMLMPELHGARHDAYISRFLATGEARIIGIGRELDARRKDGSTLPIHLAVSEVVVEGQRTFTGIMRDISLERSDKEEIRRQNERLSVTVRNAPMGIVTYRFGATFASTNRAFESMIGYSNSELSKLDLAALTQQDDRRELKRLTDDARSGRVEQFSQRLRLLHRSGTPIHVVVHNAITHDQHGVPDLIIAQIEDLTAQMHAQEAERIHQDRLTHVARLSTLGEMTAGIAHEINQPLTAISMYAQSGVRMLDAGIPKPERLREALAKLSAQSLRAGAVIDRVQRLVRKEESSFETVHINELIGDILRLAESDARVNDTQVALDLADNLATVSADPIQIQQVLLNLIRNAIDAMRGIECRHGSVITISTHAIDGDAIEVAVADLGTGVPDDVVDKLFTPFTTTKANGMGMGLSICRSIINAHGGHLSFRNNPDHGATFYFQLPTGHSHET